MRAATCWCGSEDLEGFSAEYGVCQACGTLVYRVPYEPDDFTDGTGFYSAAYWEEHVPEVDGLSSLEERATTDLFDRAVLHLERVLEYRGPGSTLLEIGCGHGGLTYLLGCTGLRAEGLEISPPALEMASSRFEITVHEGPLERRNDLPTYDSIVAVDLLEHLPHPRTTLAACRAHLSDTGLLFLQTPRFEGRDAEWSMLIPREHLFLYSESSIQTLLELEGFSVLSIEPSVFKHDMWVVAGQAELAPSERSPESDIPPEIRALIGAVNERTDVDKKLTLARADQREKEALIERLSAELAEVREDQAAKETLTERLSAELAEVREDQVAKETLTERLSAELAEVREDQAAKETLTERLSAELAEVRGDQAAKERLTEQLSAELAEVREDQAAKERLTERLSAELAEVREDQAAKERLIERVSAELADVREDQAAKEALIERLSKHGETPDVHGSEPGPTDDGDDGT